MEHITHTFLDTLILLPLLFLIYLLVEYLEHENNNAVTRLFRKTKKMGPFFGAVFGTIPQCGFSVVAAELYSRRIVTLGTLVAIFVATSDEAIPLMLAHPDRILELLTLVFIKFLIALFFGFIIDLVVRSKNNKEDEEEHHHHFHGNCENCQGGILRSAILHSVKIFIYIFVINLILGYFAEKIAPFMEYISDNALIESLIASLFGIIPNCAASVVLTELYLAGNLSLSALIGGLCSGAGVGLIVLFKRNKNLKENLMILALIYGIGVLFGTLLSFVI